MKTAKERVLACPWLPLDNRQDVVAMLENQEHEIVEAIAAYVEYKWSAVDADVIRSGAWRKKGA